MVKSVIDFDISQGTPIIAATEGEVSFVGDSDPVGSYSGGILVRVQSSQHFDLIYAHLRKVYVAKGQLLKRGQLIGLSGTSNDGVSHLHFGICKVEGSSQKYSQTYYPEKFWLDGRPKCFIELSKSRGNLLFQPAYTSWYPLFLSFALPRCSKFVKLT